MKTKQKKALRSLDDAALAKVGGGSEYTDACIGGAGIGGVAGFYAGGPVGAGVGAGLGCIYGSFAHYIELVVSNAP
jgi:Bacteriocin class II with double-glycine leader peptide